MQDTNSAVGRLVTDPAIRCAIEALVTEHAWMLDNHKSDRIGEIYTEQGRMTGLGGERIGRDAIATYGRERATMTKRHARHVCTNLRLVHDGPGRVRGLCTITLFRHDGETMGAADPVAVADAQDVYALCDDGQWRFESRHLALAFESEAHRR